MVTYLLNVRLRSPSLSVCTVLEIIKLQFVRTEITNQNTGVETVAYQGIRKFHLYVTHTTLLQMTVLLLSEQ